MIALAALASAAVFAGAAPPAERVAVLVTRGTGVTEREALDVARDVAGSLAEAGIRVEATTVESVRSVPDLGKCARKPACVAEKTAGLDVAAVVTVEVAALRDAAVLYLAAYGTRAPVLLAELETTGTKSEFGRHQVGAVAGFVKRLKTALLALPKVVPAVAVAATKPSSVAQEPADTPRASAPDGSKPSPVAPVPDDPSHPAVPDASKPAAVGSTPDDAPRRVAPDAAKPTAVAVVDSSRRTIAAAAGQKDVEAQPVRRTAAWVVLGGAGVALVTSAIFGGLGWSSESELNRKTTDLGAPFTVRYQIDRPEGPRLAQEANRRYTVAISTAVTAGVLGGIATYLFLRPEESP